MKKIKPQKRKVDNDITFFEQSKSNMWNLRKVKVMKASFWDFFRT